MAVDLEPELDRLYAADLEEFVGRRNELAKALRAEGRRDEADAVRRRRKPTITAWTANQLARGERNRLDRLLDAGHRLREAHRGLLEGKSAEPLKHAESAQRDAVRELVERGRRILDERHGGASDAALDRLSRTLRAAAVDDDARELLARGRLEEDVEPAGFDALGPLAVALAPRRPATGESRRADAGRVRRLRDAVEEARRREGSLRAEARAAEREAESARRTADRLRRVAEQARGRADEAAEALAEAKRRLEQATGGR